MSEIDQLRAENTQLKAACASLAEKVWNSRWVSDDADYQEAVAVAAEIRSGNLESGKGWLSPSEAERLQAACAEMRGVIGYALVDRDATDSANWIANAKHALSTDVGKGWLSPEHRLLVLEALRALSKHTITHAVGCSHREETCSCHKQQLRNALATLEEK